MASSLADPGRMDHSTQHRSGPNELAVTESQLQALKIISLSMSIVSLASCFFAMYWFVKMRRSFRHE